MNQQQQNFEKLFRTELESVTFEISDSDFQRIMSAWNVAMNRSSLMKMDCDIDIYRQIAIVLESNGETKFNLFNASFLFNAISKLSPNDLGVSVKQYIYLNEIQKELSNKWNELVLPIRQKLMNKLQTQAVLQQPRNGGLVDPKNRR